MTKRFGFTLVEIAIVLTIISLIAGGIVATRSIIRTTQLQAVTSEYQMYNAAIKNFQAKYLALPGDFPTATTLWGARGSCPTAGNGIEPCNGNGNGMITLNDFEHILAWQHLGLSGFINQNFTGNTATGDISCAYDIKGGDNVPSSKLKAASWNLLLSMRVFDAYTTGGSGYLDKHMPMTDAVDMPYMHALWLGGNFQDDNGAAISCSTSQIPVMTGQEAYDIDMKFDDSVATSGKIRSQYNNTATYQTCENLASTKGAYRTDATGINCSLAFILEP